MDDLDDFESGVRDDEIYTYWEEADAEKAKSRDFTDDGLDDDIDDDDDDDISDDDDDF